MLPAPIPEHNETKPRVALVEKFAADVRAIAPMRNLATPWMWVVKLRADLRSVLEYAHLTMAYVRFCIL